MLAVMVVLTGFLLWPEMDLVVSGWFYTPGKGFDLATHPLFLGMHWVAYYGARTLGLGLAVLLLLTTLRHRPVWHVQAKGWLFLFLALMIGPVLIANVVLKDHWGRARPREVTEFGGSAHFSSAWIPQQTPHKNDSFVAGDPAFAFYLTSFAYVVPRPKKRDKPHLSRRFFWMGMGVGALFGVARIVMGAHFLSDVLFAAFFMLTATAGIHAAMFGRKQTAIAWHHWLFGFGKKEVM